MVLHEGARLAGGAWMLVGITLYVVYRRGQGKSLTKRFTIPAEALKESKGHRVRQHPRARFGGCARRRHRRHRGPPGCRGGERGRGRHRARGAVRLRGAALAPTGRAGPPERVEEARRTLARAKEVGEEYEGVEVATAMVRGRTDGRGDRHGGAAPRRGGHRACGGGAQPHPRRRDPRRSRAWT